MTRRRHVVAAAAVLAAALGVLGASRALAATSFDVQQQLAAHPAVKIAVRGDGWVHVPATQLRSAGLPAGVDAASLQLFADGVEQPLTFRGNGNGILDDGEDVEFYGTGRDTLWTDARTYWLVVGAAGARVPYTVNPRGAAGPASFPFVQTLRERKTYYAPLLNGDSSNFFGATVDATGMTQTLTLNHVADASAVLRLSLQGVTAGAHAVAVSLAGAPLGTCALTAQQAAVCEFPLSSVAEGANTFALVATGAAPDISLVESISVAYDHAYLADGDRLTLTAPAKTRVTVGGFSSANMRVVDVTSPLAPLELVVGVSATGGTWAASFDVSDGGTDHTLLAFTDATALAPAAVVAGHPASWATTGSGELVILSNGQFLDAVRPLADRRTAEGWSVALIDLQDVYDEFGAGDKSAFAIRDFVRYAGVHWPVPPRDVLLVGDATFDPRNFTGLGDFDFAPTKLVDTSQMETASDDWFVDDDDDGLPDLGIGRFPARTTEQVTTIVQKLLAYADKDDLARGGLFVSDENDDGLDFEAASAGGAAAVAGLMPVDAFKRGDSNATAAGLLAKLDAGPFLVNYFGHGSVEVWEDLFSSADATALTNQQHPSIYVSMNCLNGFFHDLYTTSLAEALLEAPKGGAVAVWASSTLTSFEPQATLDREFLARLTRTSLGEADLAAKRAITDVDARRTWMLFGDPTLFGTPTSASDGGIDASRDVGAPDGGGSVGDAVDTAPRDASSDPPATDAPRSNDAAAPAPTGDGAVDGIADAPMKGGASGGCSCRTVGGSSRGATFIVSVLLAAGVRRRRRTRDR